MSNELELGDIQSDLIRSALFKAIESEAKTKKYKIKVKSASQSGATNFVGIVYRVHYEGEDEKTPSSSLILKVAPQNPVRRAQFHSRVCFLREIYVYNELLPYFRAFEQSKGVKIDENGFTEYPKCYQTVSVEPDECLVLADLCVRGFKAIDRHLDEITYDHVRLYLQALGKYHAISLALKDQQPEKFQAFAANFNEIFIQKNSLGFREFFEMQKEYASNTIRNSEHAHLLEKVERLFTRPVFDLAIDWIESELQESATVISFGDANLNNLMFKYDGAGKPSEVCLIDWQMPRVASPIIDIIFFIFSSTTKELRDVHYESLLEVYHDSLSKHLRRLGSDPEKIFPRDSMQKHLQKFGKFGLIVAFWMLGALTSDADARIDLDEAAENIQTEKAPDTNPFVSEKSIGRFTERMRGVIIDMVRLEYI